MIKCGLAELELTPPLHCCIPGYTEERLASGIQDPLYAKAFVVESGHTIMVFIAIDALMLPLREANRIRERLFRYAGIPPERVLVCATHTHTGAPVRQGKDGSTYDDYLAYMADRSADAAMIAYDNRRPAKIGCGTGNRNDLSFNRRYWMKDGSLQTNPGYLNPDIDRPAGPIDPDITVIRIEDLDGNPLGVVTNFACHTDTVGGKAYSGDYPAVLSTQLKQALGRQVVSLFMLGACGDINHCDFSGPKPVLSVTEKLGQLLAEEVLRVYAGIETIADAAVESVRTFVTMELRNVSEDEVKRARAVLDNREMRGPERFFAEQVLKVADSPIGSAELEIQVFKLGDIAFAGLPGEIFAELGLAVKRASPFPHTVVCTLSNGSIYGYVCTAQAYDQGGYEPRLKVYSRIPQGTGERIAEAACGLLRRLRGGEISYPPRESFALRERIGGVGNDGS